MNEVANVNSNVPAVSIPPSTQAVLKSDITLPKILCMQGLSQLVMDGQAKAGELVRSTTGEILGGKDRPLRFIPLRYDSLWMLQELMQDGKTWKFRGYEPRTALNETLDWDFIKDGASWKRTKTMHLYALLPQDIEAEQQAIKAFQDGGDIPDVDAALLPVVISFRNTSFSAAKDITQLFMKADSLSQQLQTRVPVYGKMMELSNSLEENDKGKFYVLHVKSSERTPKEFVEKAKIWDDLIGRMNFKVDEAEEEDAAATSSEGPTDF